MMRRAGVLCAMGIVLAGVSASGCTKKLQVMTLADADLPTCGIRRVGVGSFVSGAKEKSTASTLLGKLTQGISNNKDAGHLDFFERNPDELGRIAKELEQFQGHGTLGSKALQALQSAGLEGILFGEVTAASVEDHRRTQDVPVTNANNQSRTVHQTWKQRTGDLTVTYKLVDVRVDSRCGTGRVVASQAENETKDWEMLESGEEVIDVGSMLTTSTVERVKQLPSETTIMNALADQSVGKFLKKIQPHWVTGAIRLKSPSNPKGELGSEYAMNCNFDEAAKALEDSVAAGAGVTAADYYNLALVKDLHGCRGEALTALDKALTIDSSDAEIVRADAKLKKGEPWPGLSDSFDPMALMDRSSAERCKIEPHCSSQPEPAATTPSVSRGRVTKSLTLRDKPAKNGSAVKTFPKATELTIVDDQSDPHWWKIEVVEGGNTYQGWGWHESIERAP